MKTAHQAAVAISQPLPAVRVRAHDGIAHLLDRHRPPRADAGGGVEVTVRRHQLVLWKARFGLQQRSSTSCGSETWFTTRLQGIDVLSEATPQKALVVKQANEEMSGCWSVLSRKQLFGQHIEWNRVIPKVVYIENCFGVREIVLGQVVIQTRTWCAKVRNTSRNRDSLERWRGREGERKLVSISHKANLDPEYNLHQP